MLEYNFKYIPFITEFMTVSDWWLLCASNDNKIQQELEKPKEVLSEAKACAISVEANNNLLDAYLDEQKKDLERLTIELAAVNVLIAELERDGKTAGTNLMTARSAAQESRTALYYLEGKMTNLKKRADNLVCTAVAAATLLF